VDRIALGTPVNQLCRRQPAAIRLLVAIHCKQCQLLAYIINKDVNNFMFGSQNFLFEEQCYQEKWNASDLALL